MSRRLISFTLVVVLVILIRLVTEPKLSRILSDPCTFATPHLQSLIGTSYFDIKQGTGISVQQHNIVDAFLADVDTDGNPDFIITSIILPAALPGRSAPLRILRNCSNGIFVDGTDHILNKAKTFHARHFSVADFNNDKINDVVIADHGTDISPYPGARSLLLIGNADHQLIDETAKRLPIQPAFTYHVAAGDASGDGHLDIYLSNIAGTSAPPQLYLNNGKGYFRPALNRLPEQLTTGKCCFMSSVFADFNHDGRLELLLGGCDRKHPNDEQRRDRILLRDNRGHFTFTSEDSLPYRYRDTTWGTASFSIADFNMDGLVDILAITHNFGFTKGHVQIFINQGDLRFRESRLPFPYRQENYLESFIAWADVNDINNDGLPDVLFVLRPTHPSPREATLKVRLFLNTGHEGFLDASSHLPVQDRYFATAQFIDYDHDGHQEIFLLGYDGLYLILKPTDLFRKRITFR